MKFQSIVLIFFTERFFFIFHSDFYYFGLFVSATELESFYFLALRDWVYSSSIYSIVYRFGFLHLSPPTILPLLLPLHSISLITENFVCCSRNAIFSACEILRFFADDPYMILIRKVDEFYTGLTMIIQKNRRVRTSSQSLIHFTIRYHREKHLSTSIKYRKFQKKIYVCCHFITHQIKNDALLWKLSLRWLQPIALPIFKKVKPAIQNYKVPVKSVKNFDSRFRI